MIKTKKIFGILLALCFVLSVTAASAAASEEHGDHGAPVDNHKKDRYDDRDKFNENHKKDRHDDRDKFNEHHKKRHHHPGHWEKKKIGHREFRNHHWETVYVVKMVYIAAYDDYHF